MLREAQNLLQLPEIILGAETPSSGGSIITLGAAGAPDEAAGEVEVATAVEVTGVRGDDSEVERIPLAGP